MTDNSGFDQKDQSVETQTNIYHADQVFVQPSGSAATLIVPQQIRRPPPDFTGREDEIRDLIEKFDSGATVIGVRGLGGIGKTALALVLVDRLKDRFPDGQLFFDMQGMSKSPLKPDDAMAHIIRSYQGINAPLPVDLNGLSGLYQSVLSGKKALILLDNAANRELVERLLPPEGSALLVTSRNKFALPGLAEKDLAVLLLEDAKKLLLEISGRISEHAEELAELCGRLPIALRNAAYALKEKPNIGVADYVKRLGDARKRLELVEASFSTSYELLTPELQKLWSLLSVFPSDFDLGGAAAVWEMEQIPAEDALGELVKWSLVDFLRDTTGEGGRYRLHDLARDFSNSRLRAEERESALQRHAKYYRDLLWKAESLYEQMGHSLVNGLELYDNDYENIHFGQKWAMANTDKSFEIARICSDYAGAGGILILRLHPLMYVEWLNAALLAARKIDNRTAEGIHLGNLGLTYAALGDARQAIEYHEQAIEIFRSTGDRQRTANNMGNLGLSYSHLGEFRKALEYHKKALAVAREFGDRMSEGIRLGNIGLAYYDLGNIHKAIEYHNKALAIACEKKNIRGEGDNLGNLGLAYHDLGDVRTAIAYYEQALKISRSIKDSRSEEKDLSNLGLAYLDLGKAKKAIEIFRCALIISRKIGDRRFEGNHLGNIGRAYFFLGDIKKAIKFTELTLAIGREIRDQSQEGEALCVLGNAFDELKDTSKAIDYYKKSLKVTRKIEDRCNEGDALRGLGKVYVDINRNNEGKKYLEQSRDIFRKIKFVRGEGEALFNISLVQEKLGKRIEAVDLAKLALNIFENIESPDAEKVRQKLKEWQE
jgi:tetratricopeptide (TPR) repeat protein